MLVAGLASLACFSGGPVEAATIAIYPLQILLTAGGRFGVTSIVLSLAVRLLMVAARRLRRRPAPNSRSSSMPWWKAPPPWQAVFVGVFPAQLTRLLVRTRNWVDFANMAGMTAAWFWWYAGTYISLALLWGLFGALYISATVVVSVPAALVVTPLMWLQLPLGGLRRRLYAGPHVAMNWLAEFIDVETKKDWPRLMYAIVFFTTPFFPRDYYISIYGTECYDEALLDEGIEALDYDFMSDRCWDLVEAHDASRKALKAIPHSWWLDLLLAVWLACVFHAVRVFKAKERSSGQSWQQRWQQWDWRRPWAHSGRSSSSSAGGGGGGRSYQQTVSDDESDDSDDLAAAEHEFPMGFRAVAVPAGCKVASVKAVLQAADYYQVMGYSRRGDVSSESLKTKRRQLVLAVHPDKVGDQHPGANLAASRVNRAFETLNDPDKRASYDEHLSQ